MASVLFVDDEQPILDAIRRSMRSNPDGWEIRRANSVDEALAELERAPADVVVTDITMPRRDGFALLDAITSSESLKQIPVIVLTGLPEANLKRRALDCGAFDLLNKPVNRDDLVVRIRSVLRAKENERALRLLNQTLEMQVAERTRDLEASRTDVLFCMAMAGECRDDATGKHLLRVAQYSRCLANQLAFQRSLVELVFRTSPLHDIGKLGIPDEVLRKPGPLSNAERVNMQRHCEIGYRILTVPQSLVTQFSSEPADEQRPVNPLLQTAADIALYHHERWDGSGYPFGLSSRRIPELARIVAIADAYDALTTERSYKPAATHDQALHIISSDSGKHFDPEMVAALRLCETQFDSIRTTWKPDAFGANGYAILNADHHPVLCTP